MLEKETINFEKTAIVGIVTQIKAKLKNISMNWSFDLHRQVKW
jgi:hypothetical protein